MLSQSVSSQMSRLNKAVTILLIAVLLLAATPILSASADETGYYSPAKVTSNGRGWSNPIYALASDNLYATATKNNKTLKLTNFNFFTAPIPGNSVIDGIEVTVEGLTQGKQVEVEISAGQSFLNPASTPGTTTFTSTESIQTFGGSTDKWGKNNWNASDFQNKFAVKLTVVGNSAGAVSIDRVQVKVYFSPPNTNLVLNQVSGNYGGTADISATLTVRATGAPLAGKTVSFTLNGANAGSATTDTSGVASLSDVSLAGINAGDYPYGAGAAFAGDASYQATSITADLRVFGIATTLTVSPVSGPYGGATGPITATLTQTVGGAPISGKTIEFVLDEVVIGSALTDLSGVASIPGIDLTGYDAGSYAGALEVIFAGEANIEPASILADLVVNKATLTVTANNQTKVVGSPDPAFTFVYSGFVGGETSAVLTTQPTCTVSVPHAAAGTYPIVCSGGVDDNYSFIYVNGTLTVTAVGNPPTNITLSNSSINEQLPAGTTIGTFSTTDPDAGNTFTYSFCGGANDASFTITGNTLKSAAVFNWITKRSYSICVRSTDNTALSTTKNFTITVNKTTATFQDVPTTYWSWMFVERLYAAGITGGCATGPLRYCPEDTVTRAQMAVFLLRGIHGSTYNPPAVGASTGFTDVPTTYWAAAWIKQLAAEGITGGCGTGLYCPEAPVTRAQMAVFLLRSKHGTSYSPPAVGSSTGFTDVPTTYWAAAWIKQLVAEAITSGCGTGTYCPESPVTRAQMAVFLVKTFGLP